MFNVKRSSEPLAKGRGHARPKLKPATENLSVAKDDTPKHPGTPDKRRSNTPTQVKWNAI